MKELKIPITVATEEIMEELEEKGYIIRLFPSRHRFKNPSEGGEGRVVYESSGSSGSHKLIAVSVDRLEFSAFGVHNENEEFLLLEDNSWS